MAWGRMELYLKENPDVAKHIAANLTLFDEEKIEFLNAKIDRWFNPRTPNSSIGDYTKATLILKGVEQIMHALDKLLLRRAHPAKESGRLRASRHAREVRRVGPGQVRDRALGRGAVLDCSRPVRRGDGQDQGEGPSRSRGVDAEAAGFSGGGRGRRWRWRRRWRSRRPQRPFNSASTP